MQDVLTEQEPDLSPRARQFEPRLKVLLAADGSEHSNKAARVLAGMLNPGKARVTILTVLSGGLEPTSYLGDLSDAAERRAEIAVETLQATATARQVIEASGQEVVVRHRLGHPPDEILAEVLEASPELLVVGRRGLSMPTSWVLGSVSQALLHHAPCPVLVVP